MFLRRFGACGTRRTPDPPNSPLSNGNESGRNRHHVSEEPDVEHVVGRVNELHLEGYKYHPDRRRTFPGNC
jgi:hypothetical protein